MDHFELHISKYRSLAFRCEKKVTEHKGIAIGFIKHLKRIAIPSQWGLLRMIFKD